MSIDATIAEVVLNNDLNYGVQFFLKSRDIGLPANKGSIDLTQAATSALISRVLPGFNFQIANFGYASAFSRREAPEAWQRTRPKNQRAWGTPGARCTRSPLCNKKAQG